MATARRPAGNSASPACRAAIAAIGPKADATTATATIAFGNATSAAGIAGALTTVATQAAATTAAAEIARHATGAAFGGIIEKADIVEGDICAGCDEQTAAEPGAAAAVHCRRHRPRHLAPWCSEPGGQRE